MSLIGITFGTILLPELSKIYKKKEYARANILQNKAVKIALTISIPSMFGLFLLARPIIGLIYERGEFSANDTAMTANALMAFSLGLPAFVLAKILTPIFYANLDTKTPFKITIYSLLTNIVLNILLMIPFGHVGIALGSSIAAWFNVWLLNKYAKQYGEFKITRDSLFFSFKIIVSSCFMAAFIIACKHYYSHLFYDDSFLIKISSIIGTIIVAVIAFILCSLLMKMHKTLLKKE